MENKYIILNNNAVLISSVKDEGDSYLLKKPYLVIPDGGNIILIPWLKDLLGFEVNETSIDKSNVLTVIDCENNSVLQTYIKQISNIVTNDEIILG